MKKNLFMQTDDNSGCVSAKNSRFFRVLIGFVLVIIISFGANNSAVAECPPKLPWQTNDWEEYNIDPLGNGFTSWLRLPNGCILEFRVCRRMLEEQPVGDYWPPRYEYYISSIRIVNSDCDIDNLDIAINFREIIELWIPKFARFLEDGGNIIPFPCGSGEVASIVRIGTPSCIAEYTVTRWGGNDGPSPPVHTKTIAPCIEFSRYAICRSIYEFCYDNGIRRLIPIQDGSALISCPASIRVTLDLTVHPPVEAEVKCHPVCNMHNQPILSIKESITNTSISPNPTVNGTTLTFTVLTAGDLNIQLVNVSGQELMEIHNAYAEVGDFTKHFTIANFPTGVYYLKISHNNRIRMEKIIRN